jgi:hypothetical protein
MGWSVERAGGAGVLSHAYMQPPAASSRPANRGGGTAWSRNIASQLREANLLQGTEEQVKPSRTLARDIPVFHSLAMPQPLLDRWLTLPAHRKGGRLQERQQLPGLAPMVPPFKTQFRQYTPCAPRYLALASRRQALPPSLPARWPDLPAARTL